MYIYVCIYICIYIYIYICVCARGCAFVVLFRFRGGCRGVDIVAVTVCVQRDARLVCYA